MQATIRVGVIGANGRMGAEVCRSVDADDDLKLVAKVTRNDPLDVLVENGAEVAVDFSTPEAVESNIRFCLDKGIHVVVGATGLTEEDLERVASNRAQGVNVFYAPNFALGAVLMMRFAAQASKFFSSAEIIERHHEKKTDSPSGTSLRTAALMNEARRKDWVTSEGTESLEGARGADAGGIRIHSLRVPGSVAHQEVILGAHGETLTIRHDSLDRASFMPGVILAVKQVGSLDGVVVGLEQLLDLDK